MSGDISGSRSLSPADRASLWILLLLGAIIAVTTIVFGVMRIYEVVLGESIPVTADLSNFEPELAVDDESSISFSVDTATFSVPQLSGGAFVAALAQPILIIFMTLGFSVSLFLLARNVLRGNVFSRSSTAALLATWAFACIGFIPQPALQALVATDALDQIGLEAADMLSIQFSPFPFVALAIILAIATHAFSVGVKLQSETEGLV